jgi:hypothetical protein
VTAIPRLRAWIRCARRWRGSTRRWPQSSRRLRHEGDTRPAAALLSRENLRGRRAEGPAASQIRQADPAIDALRARRAFYQRSIGRGARSSFSGGPLAIPVAQHLKRAGSARGEGPTNVRLDITAGHRDRARHRAEPSGKPLGLSGKAAWERHGRPKSLAGKHAPRPRLLALLIAPSAVTILQQRLHVDFAGL